MATATKKPTKQPETKKTVVEKTSKKAEKIEAVKKVVNVAVDKIVSKKMTPAKSMAEVGKSIATIAEAKKAKKSVEKINKEAELGRRLNRAKSSLAAGLAAAMKSDQGQQSAQEGSVDVKTPAVSYMAKPPAPPKKASSATISFDQITTTAETKPVVKPMKTSNNKVSFDALMENASGHQVEAFDVTAYLKK